MHIVILAIVIPLKIWFLIWLLSHEAVWIFLFWVAGIAAVIATVAGIAIAIGGK